MTLPDIPGAAVAAVHHRRWLRPRAVIRIDLQDAWPYLYAAALRHAADENGPEDYDGVAAWLRRMADEATPGKPECVNGGCPGSEFHASHAHDEATP